MPDPLHLIEPLGVFADPGLVSRGDALPLSGGNLAFAFARLHPGRKIVRVSEVPPPWRDQLVVITAKPPVWAGLPAARPAVMGILNVTPDSFSDGGRHIDPDVAVASGEAMIAAGADIIDIGGESTRPGSTPITAAEEIARIRPVLRGLAGQPLSVDTRHAATMAMALEAGARVINDISALRHDPDAAPLLAAHDCPILLMHMRGDPATMQQHAHYDDPAAEVVQELAERLEAAEKAGIARHRIAVDPGVGFAKNAAHSLDVLRRLPLLCNLGCAIVVGASRKRFIGATAGIAEAQARVAGSLAAALHAVANGATMVRVHDVQETVQALKIWHTVAFY